MTTNDTLELRTLLAKLLPGLVITASPAKSGQRVVYFAHFEEPADAERQLWGPVVIKTSEQLAPRQIAYLQKEIEILNGLDSPFYPKLLFNNVFVEDPETDDPLPEKLFVSIEERIDSRPLTEVMTDFKDEKIVLGLLLDIVSALDLLWSQTNRLVHRDLKPANILIKKKGGIAIIDLGIVREEGAVGGTETLAPYGPCSPPYASPEQARNDKKHISFKSDFFALGTIAYELLSGTNPYFTHGDTRDDVLEKVRSHTPPNLLSLGKATEATSRLIERIMKKQPYERFRTPTHLREAIIAARGTP